MEVTAAPWQARVNHEPRWCAPLVATSRRGRLEGRRAFEPAARSSRTIRTFLLLAALVLLLGGVIFVLTWDIPAPTRPIEVVVPDDRLPR